VAPSSAEWFIDPCSRNTFAELPEPFGHIFTTDPPQLLDFRGPSAMKIVIRATSKVHEWTKHIDIRHHFSQDTYHKGCIRDKYLPTNKIMPDIFTNVLQRKAHQHHVKGIGFHTESGTNLSGSIA
jgi:hypothetical protein